MLPFQRRYELNVFDVPAPSLLHGLRQHRLDVVYSSTQLAPFLSFLGGRFDLCFALCSLQVKELGLYYRNCPAAAVDVDLVIGGRVFLLSLATPCQGHVLTYLCPFPLQQFEIYWTVAGNMSVPTPWPAAYSPTFNLDHPGPIYMNGSATNMFFSTSPPWFRPPGWVPDDQAIVHAMTTSEMVLFLRWEDFA